MDCFQLHTSAFNRRRRRRQLVISMALLLVSSFTHEALMAEGRVMPGSAQFLKGNELKMRGRALIGSRPPRCERRCIGCVHCEAIQVPISSFEQRKMLKHFTKYTSLLSYITLSSRGDDLSNYKPMRWKCKCGSSIFDP